MLEFLQANIANIILVLVAIAGAIIAVRYGYIEQVKHLALQLVLKAEQALDDNAEKKAMVVAEIYEKLPSILKLLLSEQTIDDLIELAVKEMKEALEG